MKVVVTGATGFVGRALSARLAAGGHEIVPITRSPQAGAIAWDFARGSVPPALPGDATGIVHLAQSRAYRNFPADTLEMFSVNVASTHALLNAAVAAGIPKFCLISSGTVYEPFLGSMREDAHLSPTSYLGASKLAGEILAQPYSSLISLAVLRLFFPYGVGQTGRLIPELVRRVSGDIPVDVGPDEHGLRLSPTHVDDICDAIVASLEAGWTGTFNIAAPEVLSIAEIANLIGGALGKTVLLNRVATPAPTIRPDLSRLARVHDLGRMRLFRDAVGELVTDSFPGIARGKSGEPVAQPAN